MKLKLVSFIILIVVLSGCSIDYNLYIEDDSLFEEVIIIDDNDSLKRRYVAESIDLLLSELIYDFEEQFSEEYSFEKVLGEERSGLIVTRNINTFQHVKETSPFIYNSCFQTRNFVRDRGKIIINMRNQTNCDSAIPSNSDLTVNIISSIPLVEGNFASSYDDIYTWNMSENYEENEVVITLDNNLRPTEPLIQSAIIQNFAIFIGILVATFSIIGYIIYIRYKQLNEL